MEFYPIPDRCRDLLPTRPLPWNLNDHMFSLRQPIRKFKSRFIDASHGLRGSWSKGNFLVLRSSHIAWFGIRLLVPARDGWQSLEGMDELFSLPWTVIGRKGAQMTAGKGSVAEAIMMGNSEKIAEMAREEKVENAGDRRF